MRDRIKVGVIGLGMGRSHLEAYLSLPQTKVIGICDIWRERVEEREPSALEIKGKFYIHTLLGEGDVDHLPLFKILKEINYSGYFPVSVIRRQR